MFASQVITRMVSSLRPSALTIRPARAEDADLIMQMHQQLSADTLYQRYHIERIPSHGEFRKMYALDGRNGRSFLALLPGNKHPLVGLATYVTNPELPIVAEVALLVADDYQGQGIGRKLMNRLVEEAQKQNIRFFDGYIKSSNRPMVHLLRSSGKLTEIHYDPGAVEMRVELGVQQPPFSLHV